MLDLLIPSAQRPFLAGRSDVIAAYSLRRLSGTYAGALVRVRRSSDSAEMDFGYGRQTPAAIWAGISSFIGSGNGFVSKWYDQSGNGRDLVQATTASQPKFSFLSNGLPGVVFDGADDALQTAAFGSAISQPVSFNIVDRWIADDGTSHFVFDGLTLARLILQNNSTAGGVNCLYAGGGPIVGDTGVSQPTGTRGAIGGVFNSSSSDLDINAATIASFSGDVGNTGDLNGITLGAGGTLARFANIEVQELVFFNTAHGRTQIKADNATMRAAWKF